MPTWSKISHISLSTRDKDVTSQWLERVLGFASFEEVHGEGWSGVMLIHAPSATVMECQQHDANQGEVFDPTRTGLDHIGFLVTSREALDEWQAHFEQLGIDYTPVAERDYGSVLTFRDPDQRQFEMFFRPDHP